MSGHRYIKPFGSCTRRLMRWARSAQWARGLGFFLREWVRHLRFPFGPTFFFVCHSANSFIFHTSIFRFDLFRFFFSVLFGLSGICVLVESEQDDGPGAQFTFPGAKKKKQEKMHPGQSKRPLEALGFKFRLPHACLSLARTPRPIGPFAPPLLFCLAL